MEGDGGKEGRGRLSCRTCAEPAWRSDCLPVILPRRTSLCLARLVQHYIHLQKELLPSAYLEVPNTLNRDVDERERLSFTELVHNACHTPGSPFQLSFPCGITTSIICTALKGGRKGGVEAVSCCHHDMCIRRLFPNNTLSLRMTNIRNNW